MYVNQRGIFKSLSSDLIVVYSCFGFIHELPQNFPRVVCGTVAVCLVLLSASSILGSDELMLDGDWKPIFGGEYAATNGLSSGTVDAGERDGFQTLKIAYDLKNSGRYFGAIAKVNVNECQSIKFKVFSEQKVGSFEVRVQDDRNQGHGKSFIYDEPGKWQEYEFSLDSGDSEMKHWIWGPGGTIDKMISFPIKQIAFVVDVTAAENPIGVLEVGKIEINR